MNDYYDVEIDDMWCCAHCGTLYAEEPQRCECGWYIDEDDEEE